MKIYFIILSFLFLFAGNSESHSSRIQMLLYNFEVSFQKSAQELDVNLVCTFRAESSTDSMLFVFSEKSLIKSIKLEMEDHPVNLTYGFIGRDSLFLKLPEIPDFNNDLKLDFNYSFPTGKFNDTLFYADRGDRWYPMIMDQVVPFKLIFKVPKEISAISSGNLVEEKIKDDISIYTWESEMPVFKLPIILFNPLIYRETDRKTADKEIRLYTISVDSGSNNSVLNHVADAFDYFCSEVGEYPYKTITFFEVGNFGGINIGSGLLMVGTESLTAIQKGYFDLILMPLAVQWFGASVFGKYIEPGFFFINISLPHYLRLMYIRHSQGEDAFNNSLMEPLDNYKKFAGQENDIPLIKVDYPNTKEKGLILYGKGPYILSKLEKEMGIITWMAFIRNLYESFNGKILTFDKFKKILGSYNEKALIDFNLMISEKGLP